jgi:hypothetical protein
VKSKKQLAAEKAAELNALFKPVVDKKSQVAAGVDPKSVVCQFFKAGTCTKGNRCKFSHDLSKERKAAKIDMYSDRRDGEGSEQDTMEDWDENKLRDVVTKKHGVSNRTDIICKYFLDAIEQRKYGWFWSCPSGNDKCMYRHALPPGFVLTAKKKKDEDEEEEEKVPLEDLLEAERRSLKNATPLTLELFMKWKEDKRLAKEKAALERKEKIKAGKAVMSGREAFEFNPDLIAGDDDFAFDEEELRKVPLPLSSIPPLQVADVRFLCGRSPPTTEQGRNRNAGGGGARGRACRTDRGRRGRTSCAGRRVGLCRGCRGGAARVLRTPSPYPSDDQPTFMGALRRLVSVVHEVCGTAAVRPAPPARCQALQLTQ